MENCRYCNADISHLHWRSVHCRWDECQDLYDAERLERVKEANERHNRKRAAVKHPKKTLKPGQYRCRYCNKRLPKDGNRFFCNEWCRNQYAGVDRIDGDWMVV